MFKPNKLGPRVANLAAPFTAGNLDALFGTANLAALFTAGNLVAPFSIINLAAPFAHAFDPFTIAAGAQAASGVASGLNAAAAANDLSDLADSGLAVGELLTEFDVDLSVEKDTENIVKKLNEVKDFVYEAKYTNAELKDLLDQDELNAKNFAGKLRSVKRLVQIVKRIGVLLGLRPKAAEKAFQIQQTQVSYLMLDELMAIHRGQFNNHLKDESQNIKRKVILEKLEREEKSERTRLLGNFKSRGSR